MNRGIKVLDPVAEPRVDSTCDCLDFTHGCIMKKSDWRFPNITSCIATMILFVFVVVLVVAVVVVVLHGST